MSPKLSAKNISYDASLPPFLQRLRAQNTASPAALPRPKRARNPNDSEEDEPVYVDADGATLDATELRSLGVKKGEPGKVELAAEQSNPEGEVELGNNLDKTRGEKTAAIGAARRRKAGRVVGVEEEEVSNKGDKEMAIPKKNTQASTKKKTKKVKLSFGDDE